MALESKTNCKKIVDTVLYQITCGTLKKGDKLPTERQLAEEMDVSRASVREAIKSLESMGIVNSIQGSGSYITSNPEETINRPLCALFALSNGTLESILHLRIMVESDACKDIIRHASGSEIEALCALADYDYVGELPQQAILDAKFHHALVQMSGDTLLKYLYTTLSSLMQVYREKVLVETQKMNENEITRNGHFAICSALKNRDIHAAEIAVAEHLDLSDIYRKSLLENE